jgi:electron transfer flavoprotein beta subunit
MNILVFTKRVAATQEESLRIVGDGKDIDMSKLAFTMNDWDTYAAEAAVKIVEGTGGLVTAISMGDAGSDEVLRRAIAMGANEGFLVEVEDALDDPFARASLIHNFLRAENIAFDAIFTGVQSEDDQFASFGGILAGLFGLPFASMVVGIDNVEHHHMVIRRELEGGVQEKMRIRLPCVLAIQTGANEPRYVSIMSIRKALKVERKVYKGSAYRADTKTMIRREKWVYPEKNRGATILAGELSEVCKKLLEILQTKGVHQ